VCGWGRGVSNASVSFCLTVIGHMHPLFEYVAHKKFLKLIQENGYNVYGTVPYLKRSLIHKRFNSRYTQI
jgi:hypothetical protein